MACFSQRIGSKSVMLSDHTDNSNLCYKWTRAGMEQLTGLRYVCAGCRKLRDAKHVPTETPLPTRKAIGDQWVDDGPMHAHFCQPFERAKVQGEQERRKVQNELAIGSRENVASAKVRIDVRVVQNYMNISEEERNKIRNEACGNAKATKKALYRAQTKRFMNVRTLQGLAQNDCRALWITLRARSAAPESPFYDELLMRYLDDDLAIFASPRQLQLLKKSAVIVSDGTFKQAPKGIYQVYRVFGFVAATHAVPLQELEDTEGELMISQANFDFEPASIEEFRLNFIHVRCKMCCFHVRQAMHRRIQRMGLVNLYTSREQEGRAFQALLRKIGALQFAPPNHVNRSLHLMQQLINESELELVIRLSLLDILEYYATTWVRNSIGSEFFSLFDVPVHRTINHAESYHGRQRWFYQPHQLLGRWLVNLQEVNHAEEESAVSIQEGLQPPSQPLAVTAEIDASIAREKADIMAFLDSDYEDEQFTETLSRYYGRIGHLIGFNVPPRLEIEEQIEEAAAMEEAEASLNESGIYVVPNDENLDPC
ncbi:hypothetical protein niasHT_006327 [Heterodera trifolii]|uniref:Transposase n=1 Tax=Heterodera trifolii TaxID=157864 RepID=A0ABD2M4M0_9BILA